MSESASREYSLRAREVFLTRVINLVLLLLTIALAGLTHVLPALFRGEVNFGSLRILLMLSMVLINFLLIRKKRFRLVKILLIILPVQFLFILPSVAGFIREESYIFYPFGIVGLSLIPMLILNLKRNPQALLVSLIYFLALVLTSDLILDYFGPGNLRSQELIHEFYQFYKGAPMMMMIYLQGTIYYLRRINLSFEGHLHLRQEEANRERKRAEELNEEILLQHESLTRHRDLIAQQNKLFKESVTYARHIQQAVLPSPETLQELLPGHFVFYRPRDVVSGDFYWIEAVDEYVVIAVADCTGHGVPGAFMSMLGISFLQDVIATSFKEGPDGMMEALRQKVIQSLRLTGQPDDPKMGMDMGLVIYDPVSREIRYCGAQQHLYVFNAGHLIKVKGDPIPVGMDLPGNKGFSSHLLELERGDTFYMFSDGFPDQFGGPEDKKFGYPRLKKLLHDLQLTPMKEQGFACAAAFEKWKGSLPQLDDVVIFGVRC